MASNTNTNGNLTIINDYFKSVYNGNFQNIMYFYEKSRKIVVIFTYDYQTGNGEYTACIWHHNPEKPNDISWHRKTHRTTAQERFNKCPRIPFTFIFNAGDRFFFPNLKKAIRRKIHISGVKGIQTNATGAATPKTVHSLKEYTATATQTQNAIPNILATVVNVIN